MRLRRAVLFIIILAIYLVNLFLQKKYIFTYQFNKKLIKRYLCSQDIPYEPACKRLFISDGDLHMTVGYLYATGASPTDYHFQHMPLIKYLYGYSILLFNNPYWIEIIFGIGYLLLIYLLAIRITKSLTLAFISTLLVALDPLLIMISGDISLDLGQAFFMLVYLYLSLFYSQQILLSGLALGLFAAAKFWGAVPFFFLIINSYLFYKKKINLKKIIFQLGVAFAVFNLVYLKTYLNNGGKFNIFFFQLKTLKYWFTHSTASLPFSSVILFLTGYYKSWWENNKIIKGEVWSWIWPLMFTISFWLIVNKIRKKQYDKIFIVVLIPVLYLFYLGAQAPFLRYFILVLPFFYITAVNQVAWFIVRKFSPSLFKR